MTGRWAFKSRGRLESYLVLGNKAKKKKRVGHEALNLCDKWAFPELDPSQTWP